ncbi:MAG: hypothetical protein JNK91_12260 [Ferruginibacter sp.]|nr:hypothetical protein [Ferruginibacter sp.]MBN8698563.1 hypothetical protein [Chitinophagales bacterium]
MKKIKILGTKLSRAEQKNLGGGLRDDGGGGSGGYCLHCYGWGGACGTQAVSHWNRSTVPNPNDECAIVYSGCDQTGGGYSTGSCNSLPNY